MRNWIPIRSWKEEEELTFNMENGGHHFKSSMASIIVGHQDIVDLQTRGKVKHIAPPTKD